MVQAAKKKYERVKVLRKGAAKYTFEGKKRDFPEVHIPNAVEVHGCVDMWF